MQPQPVKTDLLASSGLADLAAALDPAPPALRSAPPRADEEQGRGGCFGGGEHAEVGETTAGGSPRRHS
jgi:hypothetical protein